MRIFFQLYLYTSSLFPILQPLNHDLYIFLHVFFLLIFKLQDYLGWVSLKNLIMCDL